MEVMEFVRQNVSIWYEIKLSSSESFLHFDIVEAQAILSSDFITLREVIDSLEFVQAFI